MKTFTKFILLFVGALFMLILSLFFHDAGLFFTAASDDKLYDADSKSSDAYFLQDTTNSTVFIFFKVIGYVLSFFFMILIPLAFYNLFIKKDTSILEYVDNFFRNN